MVSATCYMTVLSHEGRGALQIATGSSNIPTREELRSLTLRTLSEKEK